MIYYIFRHAETYFSKNDIHYGNHNKTADILPDSIPVTQNLAKYLSQKDIDIFFTSPYKRCLQTAEIIEKITGKKFNTDQRIGEEMVNYGKENLAELTKRINDFIKDLKLKKYKSVAICSHGWPIALMKDLIIKGKVELKDLDNYPKAGVLVEIENKKISEIDFNS